MTAALIWGLCAGAGYLVGGIPFGFLIARAKGVDIRTVGSGNIGATNVLRTFGKPLGITTFVLDVLKGFLPAFIFPRLAVVWTGGDLSQALALVSGMAAVAGHNWPIYLRFKGGKGVATSVGALLGVVPTCIGFSFVAWVLLFFSTRYVSLASIGGAMVLVAAAWWRYTHEQLWLPIVVTVLGALIIWRHRSNILRLIAGTESRFESKKKGGTQNA